MRNGKIKSEDCIKLYGGIIFSALIIIITYFAFLFKPLVYLLYFGSYLMQYMIFFIPWMIGLLLCFLINKFFIHHLWIKKGIFLGYFFSTLILIFIWLTSYEFILAHIDRIFGDIWGG